MSGKALELIDAVRRMLHWHTGPTAPEPYRGTHWVNEIEQLDEALEELAPGQVQPLALAQPPVTAPAAMPRCCSAPAPDRSGRVCDKPEGHDGDHWTYGGQTLSWYRRPAPAATEGTNG